MQRDLHPATADASAPAPDRAGTVAPERLPSLLLELIALLVLNMLRRWFPNRFPRLPSWWNYRSDLPPGSVQQLAASIRGEFGNAIAWMCRRRGIGPGHPDWPYLARTIVAFGGSVRGFRAGLPAWGLQWWENPNVLPDTIGETPATPAADAMASLLLRQAAANLLPLAPILLPVAQRPAMSSAPRRAVLARAATGPPTGPPCNPPFTLCDAETPGAGAWPAPPY